MPASKRGELVPYWTSECGWATVYVGDCRDVLLAMPPCQFHAVVTDPPYGLEFSPGMGGRDWDAPWKVDARNRRADEMDDPVKAKFLRHNIEYVRNGPAFQQWFQSCAEAILRAARPGAHLLSFGGTRMWHRMACAVEDAGFEVRDTLMWVYGSGFPKGTDISKGIDIILGADREVVGTKSSIDSRVVRLGFIGPAHNSNGTYPVRDVEVTEPATDLARAWDGWNTALKPAWEPVLLSRKPPDGGVAENTMKHGCGGVNVGGCAVTTVDDLKAGAGGLLSHARDGRWPANLVHDGEDEQLCRYFYSAKADADDRPHGRDATQHPTVKPLDLMKYLVRLVCARGGTVLDPFMGSGSTGCAAIVEGMRFVGVEQSQEYADIAVGRLRLALAQVPPSDMPGPPTTARTATTKPPPRRLRG